ncbi:hypothetical protein C3L33_18211, partial [Rhododendron williamsianum]
MAKTDHIHTAETNEEKPAIQAEEEEQNNPKKHKKTKKNTNKEEEEIRVKIETLGENQNKALPFVGYFPSGFDTLKNQADGPTVRVFRHEKWTKRLQLVVSPNNGSQVDFVGTNYSGEATAPQLCTYALGIFRLEPRVRGLDLSVKEPSQEELTPEKKHKKMRDTTLIFGTNKRIKKMIEFEALHPKEDPEALGRKFEGVKINKEALESAVMHSSRNTPPLDSSATTPQMAYPLDKIISKGEWDYLVDILELLQDGAEVAPDGYPSFICNRLHRLESIKRTLADEERDLLIRYVLVLTLIADGFTTALSDIAKDLRMDKYTARKHFEELGCRLASENKVWLATLSLPLEFPKPKYKRKKK